MSTNAKLKRGVGIAALVTIALTFWLGLVVTPPAEVMGNLVRMLYIHPPMAWIAYLAYGITTAASLLYLWKRTRRREWDLLAAASAEAGVFFTGLTILTGSIWGRPAWGVWWTWDALLTATAVLFLLYLGYLALRQVPMSETKRGVRSAIAAIVAFIDVPIVHESVYWWKTLHQTPSVLNPSMNVEVHGSMAWTLLLGFVAFTLAYVWMVWTRFETSKRQAKLVDLEVEKAIRERLAAEEVRI
ncbi:cytochrome c biogenesis protein CcsA [Ferrimicrobium acidiphilum]|uniref:cytochrome c biogenesis protein CcsA n=1 Tax=Ferrimicrobium acidiphilum TaxID=121039 RepID=UPI0023F3D972|nr:cytochrome c biogenesis protein CcsA [Ferrimicrobium acidiphilum]